MNKFHSNLILLINDELPEHFNEWLVEDENNLKLVHLAARIGKLPYNWTGNPEDWLIEDSNRNTVADILVGHDRLPPNWTNKTKHWLRKDEFGSTFAHRMAKQGKLPTDWTDKTEDWLIKDGLGDTVAYYAVNNGILPSDWTSNPNDWLLSNDEGESIALLYSIKNKDHYNNPKSLIEYLKNIENIFVPYFSNDDIFYIYDFNIISNFLSPVYDKVEKTCDKEWMSTSENHSGFLIDYALNIFEEIEKISSNNYSYSDAKIEDVLEKNKELINILNIKKCEIKEILFSKNEIFLNKESIVGKDYI